MADSKVGEGKYQMSPKHLVPKARKCSNKNGEISSQFEGDATGKNGGNLSIKRIILTDYNL